MAQPKTLASGLDTGCKCDLCVRVRGLVSVPKHLPTVVAVCSGRCSKRGKGQSVLRYYGTSFTPRQWAKSPVCENCKAPMKAVPA